MKNIAPLLLALSMFVSNAQAAKDVGNGGHVWICYLQYTPLIDSILSIDIVEGQAFALTYPGLNGGYYQIEDFSKPGDTAFTLMEKFRTDLTKRSFYLSNLIHPHIEKILSIFELSSGPMFFTEDLDFIEGETGVQYWPRFHPVCPNQSTISQGAVYFPIADRLLVDRNIWNSPAFPEFQKFGLLLHEVMYSLYRSVSQIPTEEMSSHQVGRWTAELLYNKPIEAKEKFFRQNLKP